MCPTGTDLMMLEGRVSRMRLIGPTGGLPAPDCPNSFHSPSQWPKSPHRLLEVQAQRQAILPTCTASVQLAASASLKAFRTCSPCSRE
jgi:hypothetical protein